MNDYDAVLVYDGDCAFCSAASSALRRLPAVGAVDWDHGAAQRFLDAEFEAVPFALAFADAAEGQVYVGRAAARELCERAGVPTLVSDVVGEGYDSLSGAARTVSGAERDPDDAHGVYPFSDDAAAAYPDLAAAAESLDVSRHLPD